MLGQVFDFQVMTVVGLKKRGSETFAHVRPIMAVPLSNTRLSVCNGHPSGDFATPTVARAAKSNKGGNTLSMCGSRTVGVVGEQPIAGDPSGNNMGCPFLRESISAFQMRALALNINEGSSIVPWSLKTKAMLWAPCGTPCLDLEWWLDM